MELAISFRRAMHYLWDRRQGWQLWRALSPDRIGHLLRRRYVDLEPWRPGARGDSAVNLALTFDVERDWGSATPFRSLKAIEPFFRGILPWLHRIGAKATFLVEGGIVAERPEGWRELARQGHEIGLHGHDHESWGVDWFTDLRTSPLIDRKRADELLLRACQAFARAGLAPPRSFRAPNLVLDREFRSLLWRHGFRVDSSASSMKGERPVVRWLYGPRENGLVSVPVTSAIVPSVGRVGVLPYSSFKMFTLQNVLRMTSSELVTYVEDVCRYQLVRGQCPHLVLLAHPWEFVDPPHDAPAGLGWLGAENFERLEQKVNVLRTALRIRFSTLSDLASQFVLNHRGWSQKGQHGSGS